MPQPQTLTLEQQFCQRSFETQVDRMSEAQAKQFLVRLHEQMLCREALHKKLLAHKWGIEKEATE